MSQFELQFWAKVLVVIGKALSGELSCTGTDLFASRHYFIYIFAKSGDVWR